MNYDVIISGAGPSGATIASLLARAGLEVLVLEKEFMPRDKPCGGGVTYKAARLLDFPWQKVIEDTTHTVIFSYRGKGEVKIRPSLPVAFMVTRRNFDSLLLERAKEAGACIVEGASLKELTVNNDYVLVTAGENTYRGRIFVGADGANGKSARLLGLHSSAEFGPTLEAEVECPEEILERHRGVIGLDCGALPWGYGWVFPKKNRLSVGVGAFTRKVNGLRLYLNDYFNREGLGNARILSVRGYPIPIGGGRKRRIHHKLALLIGDAAGLVDPFCGEGIYYALKSAHLAAEAILNNKLYLDRSPRFYQELVDRHINVELAMARRLAKIFYTLPHLSFELIEKRPEIAERLCRIIYGDGSYTELKGAAMKIIRTLASRKKMSGLGVKL